MRERRALIILGSGILIALSAAILTYGWLNGKARTLTRATETRLVAVAVTDLEWGTVISKDMVETVPFLKQTLPEGCFSDVAKLEGRALAYPVKAREPIFESRLAPSNVKEGGLAAVVETRKRAMVVKVDKITGTTNFVHPGDRVDVIATFGETKGVPAPLAKTVLENVLVLATGSEAKKAEKNEKPLPADTITLEVGADEGERLALAAAEGKLRLALRNVADSTGVRGRGTTMSALMSSRNGSGAGSKGKGAPGAGGSAPSMAFSGQDVEPVELIRGTTVTALRFRRGE